jgi:hypothetical protein
MATQRDIVAYLKCIVDEDNVEFEKIHKVITKWVNCKGEVIFVKVYNHNLSSLLRLLIPF